MHDSCFHEWVFDQWRFRSAFEQFLTPTPCPFPSPNVGEWEGVWGRGEAIYYKFAERTA